MSNIEIKGYAKRCGVAMWELAEHLSISESQLSRRMRRELSDEEKHKMLADIKAIAEAKYEAISNS